MVRTVGWRCGCVGGMVTWLCWWDGDGGTSVVVVLVVVTVIVTMVVMMVVMLVVTVVVTVATWASSERGIYAYIYCLNN